MLGLPTPRTTTEELLAVLIFEVQGLRADLNAARGGGPSPADELVTVTEPKPTTRRTSRGTSS